MFSCLSRPESEIIMNPHTEDTDEGEASGWTKKRMAVLGALVFLLLMIAIILLVVLVSGGSADLMNVTQTPGMYSVSPVIRGALQTRMGRVNCPAPPTREALYNDWDGKSLSPGTQVQYRCGTIKETAVALVMLCSRTGRWQQVQYEPENCNLGGEIEDEGPPQGCIEEEPPKPDKNVYRDWNGLVWDFGTIIHYKCTADIDSPKVMTVECQPDKKWSIINRYDENCTCSQQPPKFDMNRLTFLDAVQRVGSIAGLRCTTNPDSPYESVLKCDVKKKWAVIKTYPCP